MRRYLAYLVVFSILPACAKKQQQALPIAADYTQKNAWSQTLSTKDQNDDKRDVTVSYKFVNLRGVSTWERSLLVKSSTGTQVMIESGDVISTTAQYWTLQVTASSCEAEDVKAMKPFKLYFISPSKNSLQISQNPFPASQNSVPASPNPLPASPVVAPAGAASKPTPVSAHDALASTFSFGAARNFLNSGEGQFTAGPLVDNDQTEELGCFTNDGMGFSKSIKKMKW